LLFSFVATASSSLKLFFRELPEPLVSRVTRDELYAIAATFNKGGVNNDKVVADKMRECFRTRAASGWREEYSVSVLTYLMKHLFYVSKITANKERDQLAEIRNII
jgi:hypothetical protein